MSNTNAATAPTSAAGTLNGTTHKFRDFISGSGGAFVGLLILVITLCLTTRGFADMRNALNIIDQVSVLGVMALGATAVIITGGIDLSVGSVLALSTMTLGWMSHFGPESMFLGIVGALVIGAFAGLVNGLSITVTKLPPFIATLAMMSICRGLANLITDGNQIVGYPEWFFHLSSHRYYGFLSVNTCILILMCIIAYIIMQYTVPGRSLYAIGGNAEVARLAGVKVKQLTTWVYVATGALAGLAGIIMATRLDSSQPSAGMTYELDVIAAVVIGGASLSGGTGRITGTVVGVLIIGVLRNGLNLLGVSSFWQSVIVGVVIAAAVMGDVLRSRSK